MWRTVLVLIVGCYGDSLVPCGTLTCPNGRVCSPTEDRCVFVDQIDACNGASDGDGCTAATVTSGLCYFGVCIEAGCGNKVLEPGELCDDGNRFGFDGCSADCSSDERCGNGVVDVVLGEQCDCGDDAGGIPAACEAVNANTADASCRTTCQQARCGDGVLAPGEWCDDGNQTPGDGCRADCMGRFTTMVSGTLRRLYGVWANRPNNAYAVGDGRILHWDGSTWSSMTITGQPIFTAVCGTSSHVYALASPRIDELVGNQWTSLALPVDFEPLAIHCTTDTLYVGGEIGGAGALFRWDGGWTSLPATANPIRTLYVPSEDNVFAMVGPNSILQRNSTGTWQDSSGPFWNQALFGTSPTNVFAASPVQRFDGAQWTAPPGGSEGNAFAIGGVEGDILIVGNSGVTGNAGIVSRFDGTKWALLPVPPLPETALLGVSGYAPGRAFVVGALGTILY